MSLGPVVGIALLLSACGGSAGGGTSSGTGSGEGTGAPPTPTAATGVSSGPTQQPVPTEKPVPAESNPPGDIPDNTAFVPYRAAGGFVFKIPEGWARKNAKSRVTFTDKLNSVAATWTPASAAPTVASAKKNDVPQLQTTERAFTLESVKSVSLPGGPAILITFQANSAPNAVTGKQYRLDVERFEFFRSGTEAVLSLSSPVGADNVDPWRIVSESFQWR